MSLTQIFRTIDDLPGVNGSFCLSSEGELLHQTLKAPFSAAIFSSLGPRVNQLFQGVEESYTSIDECIIGFEGYSLYLRRGIKQRIIGVVSEEKPNLTAMRVSCNLVFRQLPDDMEAVKPVSEKSAESGPRPSEEAASDERPKEKVSIFGGGRKSSGKSSGGGIWG